MEQKDTVVSKIIEALKNSKTDEEFNENLKQYTLKLYEFSQELDKQKELNKSLRNQNRLLTLELAQRNIDLAELKLQNDKLKLQLTKPPEKSESLLDEMSMNLDKSKEKKK